MHQCVRVCERACLVGQAERARAAKELQEMRERLAKELADAGASSSKTLNDRLDAERSRHDAEVQQLRAQVWEKGAGARKEGWWEGSRLSGKEG